MELTGVCEEVCDDKIWYKLLQLFSMYSINMILGVCCMELAVYGAKSLAFGMFCAIRELYPEYPVQCFVVSSMRGNSVSLAGLPVKEKRIYISRNIKCGSNSLNNYINRGSFLFRNFIFNSQKNV